MPVEVRPATFSMVFFEATEIEAIVERLVAEIGLPADLSVAIEVDDLRASPFRQTGSRTGTAPSPGTTVRSSGATSP